MRRTVGEVPFSFHQEHQHSPFIPELTNDFRELLFDRRRFAKEKEVFASEIVFEPPAFERLEEKKREAVLTNIKLSKMLNGHRGSAIRSLLAHTSGEASEHMTALYGWSQNLVREGKATFEEVLASDVPKLLKGVESPEELYERLAFCDQYEVGATNYQEALATHTAHALGLDEKAKWIEMLDVFFSGDPLTKAQSLIEQVGFIPREFYAKQKFRGLGPVKITQMIAALRELEQSYLRPKARYERAKLVNAFLLSGNANALRKSKGKRFVTLDTNGIRIDLSGFRSHIPYGLMDEALPDALEQQRLLSDSHELIELKVRMAEENSEVVRVEELEEIQMRHVADTLGYKTKKEVAIAAEVVEDLLTNPDQFARRVKEHGLILPDRMIEMLFEDYGEQGTYAAFRFAEAIGAEITGERLTRKAGLFASHALLRERDETYEARSRVLNHPDYYQVAKIVRQFLSKPITSDANKQYLLYRGQYKQAKGNQHSFIEVVYRDRPARVLVNEEKHLGLEQKNQFDQIELFEREAYERLEDALRTFDYFSTTIQNIKSALVGKQKKQWQQRVRDLMETAMHFLVTNEGTEYIQAKEVFTKLDEDHPDLTQVQELVDLFERSRNRYADFLYNNVQTLIDHKERFDPELTVREIAFGKDFADEMETMCPEYGYDRALSEMETSARVVTIDYKVDDPTQSIPFHIEEAALDRLRVLRNRPLINVIGGCRFVGELERPEDHPLFIMSESIIRVAHKHKANVGIPGTQSGIGAFFGKQVMHYNRQQDHLPRAEKAHIFAISPAGNTHFPGNRYTPNVVKEERYAMTPVDQLMTPFAAEWEREGTDRFLSPYRTHIAYMEALYARMSLDQPQVMVVGDGGLYSMMEINESLRHGFSMLLLKDAGRFSEIAAALITTKGFLENDLTGDALDTRILEILKDTVSVDVLQEYLKKDFGNHVPPENDNYHVHRIFLHEFIGLARKHRKQIRITSVQDLEKDLDGFISGAL